MEWDGGSLGWVVFIEIVKGLGVQSKVQHGEGRMDGTGRRTGEEAT